MDDGGELARWCPHAVATGKIGTTVRRTVLGMSVSRPPPRTATLRSDRIAADEGVHGIKSRVMASKL
jgi:hypothetical protein